MALTINGSSALPIRAPKKKKVGHTDPQVPKFSFDEPGHKVRIANFQSLMGGISHSAFMKRRKRNLIPEPDGRDRRPFWWSETVKAFIQSSQRRKWEKFHGGRAL
ncbi:MAG: hypothetical protein HY017_24960 [Betaproteobacteria bacterium]|nr:hypothetical protein [Betaproteobacteria bacterium]